MNCGGLAGTAAWTIALPSDIVKTKQMTHLGAEPMRFMEALKQLLQEGGVGRIFRGAGPTLVKAYYTNMIILPLYDLFAEFLRDEK